MNEEQKEQTVREFLTETRDIRIREAMSRPNIEVWPDPWVDWVESHRRRRAGRPENAPCDLVEQKANPDCGLGYH